MDNENLSINDYANDVDMNDNEYTKLNHVNTLRTCNFRFLSLAKLNYLYFYTVGGKVQESEFNDLPGAKYLKISVKVAMTPRPNILRTSLDSPSSIIPTVFTIS